MVEVVSHPDTYKCSVCGKEFKYRITAETCEKTVLEPPKHKVGDSIRVYDYGISRSEEKWDTVVEVRLLHSGPIEVVEHNRTEDEATQFLAKDACRPTHEWGLRVSKQHYQFDDPPWSCAWFKDEPDWYDKTVHTTVWHPPSHTSGMSHYGDDDDD
jgi:hypothetical protein